MLWTCQTTNLSNYKLVKLRTHQTELIEQTNLLNYFSLNCEIDEQTNSSNYEQVKLQTLRT